MNTESGSFRDRVVPVFREGKEWLAEHSRVSFGDKLSRMAKFYNLRTCELESLPFTASSSRIPPKSQRDRKVLVVFVR